MDHYKNSHLTLTYAYLLSHLKFIASTTRKTMRKWNLAVAASASVRTGCVGLIAGQFQSQGQKISYRGIHLQNLRGHFDGSSWLVTFEPTSVRLKMFNSFMDFSQGQTIFMTLAGVDSLVLRGKIRSSSVVVRDFCSLSVRAHRCRTVSSSAHWTLVSYRFLALVRRQCCPFFWGILQRL